MTATRIIACALLQAALALPAAAGPPAGMIKNSRGAASIERDGRTLAASAGAQVEGRDRITTNADGSLGILLRDDTMLSVGPNSVVSLDQFAFDPATSDGALRASVKRGTMAVISGKLAKKTPGAVQFSTPSAILGVRGTEFVIEVGEGEQ